MLAWLSVCSEVQTCIWPSWCHCHSLSLASVKSWLVLPFWYRLTCVVPEKGPLNRCVSVCVCVLPHLSFFFAFSLLISSLTYLFFENRPAPFPGRMSQKAAKSGFSFFCVVIHFFDWWMPAFVVLGLFFSIPNQETGLRKRLQNALFCVECGVKPQLSPLSVSVWE